MKEVTKVPGYTLAVNTDNPGNTILTNTHEPETTEVSGTKTWDDDNNRDGVRPNDIVINVLKNGQEYVSQKVRANEESNWVYAFENLPKYEQGEEIKYTVTENDVENYTPKVSGYDIENKHTPGKTNHFVSKAWSDSNDQDGKRPNEIKVQLYGNDQKIGKEVSLNEGNHWQYNWIDLNQKENGQEIQYEVKEVTKVPGYTTTTNTDNPGSTILTNTHIPETTEVSGTKTWDDKEDKALERPEEITINLLKNGEPYTSERVRRGENDDWVYAFDHLPKYELGEEINYTITENSVDNYQTKIVGYDVINTYTPGQTNVTATKFWNDHHDKSGKRPENISVQLYQDGVKSGKKVRLSDSNNWTITWENLPVEVNGKEMTYEVKEITKVDGYQSSVNNQDLGNIIITNTYVKEGVEGTQIGGSGGTEGAKGPGNKKETQKKLPQSGESVYYWPMMLGVIVIGSTFYIYKRKKK